MPGSPAAVSGARQWGSEQLVALLEKNRDGFRAAKWRSNGWVYMSQGEAEWRLSRADGAGQEEALPAQKTCPSNVSCQMRLSQDGHRRASCYLTPLLAWHMAGPLRPAAARVQHNSRLPQKRMERNSQLRMRSGLEPRHDCSKLRRAGCQAGVALLQALWRGLLPMKVDHRSSAACASMHFVGSSRMSATPLRRARHPSVGVGTCQASPGAQSLQAMPPTCASSCCARPPRSWTQAAPTASGGTRPPAPAQGGRQGGAGQVRCSLASRQ